MAAGDPTPIDLGNVPVDKDKVRSIGIRPTDRAGSSRTKRDELGNDITHHWSDDSRQDVTIHAKPIDVGLSIQ